MTRILQLIAIGSQKGILAQNKSIPYDILNIAQQQAVPVWKGPQPIACFELHRMSQGPEFSYAIDDHERAVPGEAGAAALSPLPSLPAPALRLSGRRHFFLRVSD